MVKKLATLALGVALLVATGGTARADKCNGAKAKAIGKKEGSLLSCSSKEATKGPSGTPACNTKASGKFTTAYNKPTGCVPGAPTAGTCEGTADSCQTTLRGLLPDGSDVTPSKCEASRLKAAGKLASGELSCISKAATKALPVDAACISKAVGKYVTAFNKVSGCTGDGNAAGIQTSIQNNCVNNQASCTGGPCSNGGGNFTAITCGGAPPTTTTTTAASTTTTTTVPGCNCCSKTTLKFTNSVGGAGDCGDITPGGCASFDSGGNAGTACSSNAPCGGGTCMKDITCGGLYFGGGNEGVPLPATPPDMGQNITKITGCNTGTGAFNLTNTTMTDTGSLLTCTSGPGAGSGTCSAGNCTQGGQNGGHACTSNAQCGCLFGAPLPIPNPNSPSTSTCVINSVTTNAAGSGNCSGSLSNLSLPLNSEIYLTGDGMPKRCNAASGTNQGRQCLNNGNCTPGVCVSDPAIQPCPICNTTTNLCNGGADDGLPCVAETGNLGAAFPTSHDCRPNPPSLGGLAIGFNLTTGTQTKGSANLGAQPGQQAVFTGCGGCATTTGAFEGPPTHLCSANSDCTNGSFTVCRQLNNGAFSNPIATSISATGSASACLADGAPHAATLVSLFCTPHTGTILVDSSANLPGPGGVALVGVSQAQ